MSEYIATGHKSIYGANIGILMLETTFPRIYGEMGNARTWPFPVHYKVIKGADLNTVVHNKAEGLLCKFIAGAQELVTMGVDGITTNCGFLALFQNELSSACDVPVATSSLMQYNAIQKLLPKTKRVGIITISSKSLSEEHLKAAEIPLGAPIIGTDEHGSELTRVILGDLNRLDVKKAEEDMIEAAQLLIKKHNNIGAILLECTNMPPYAKAVSENTGLPVFDIYTYINWFQSSLAPRKFHKF